MIDLRLSMGLKRTCDLGSRYQKIYFIIYIKETTINLCFCERDYLTEQEILDYFDVKSFKYLFTII